MEEEEETDVGCGVSESLRLAQGCRREIGHPKPFHIIQTRTNKFRNSFVPY